MGVNQDMEWRESLKVGDKIDAVRDGRELTFKGWAPAVISEQMNSYLWIDFIGTDQTQTYPIKLTYI